jgi:hypothetical protein
VCAFHAGTLAEARRARNGEPPLRATFDRMAKPGSPRALLTSTARMATLVCVGAAETACNIDGDLDARPDAPRDGAFDDATTADVLTEDAPTSDVLAEDAEVDAPSVDAAGLDAMDDAR